MEEHFKTHPNYLKDVFRELHKETAIEFKDRLTSKEAAKENKTDYKELSLREKNEWIEFFNENKIKAQELKSKINRKDKEIDQIVYTLYGLNKEEIEIVENS